MLNALRRLLMRHQPIAKAACVEQLERRSLLSAATHDVPPVGAPQEPDVTPPTLVKEQLIGSDPRNVEGVVLTFSEALDPDSVADRRTYRVGKRTDRAQRFDVDNNDFQRRRGLVRFADPVYDATNFTVTLTALEPFNITRRFRTIRVLSRDVVAIRDLAGNRLDGNGDGRGRDAVRRYTFRRARNVEYGERDGDNVALTLKGPGIIWVLRKTSEGKVLARGDALRVYIDRADPATSVLTGKVTGRGNGIAVIEELVNTSTAQVQIASDPSFQIVRSIA
jgi:hypothetical protein